MKNKREPHVRNSMILFGLTLLCICAIAVSYFRSDNSISVQTAVGYVIVPMQTGINRIGTFFSDKTKRRLSLEEAEEQIESLEAENEELQDRLSGMSDDYQELQRLREYYNTESTYRDYDMVLAEIIATDSTNWNNQFTINKGTSDGITENMTVISSDGLVGLVTKACGTYSIVTSVIDDTSNVSAMSLDSLEQCVVEGDLTLMAEGKIRVGYIDKQASIEDGSKIVTSNVSDRYLPGILIGYAQGITVDDNDLTKSGYIVPAADFSHLKEVLVITTTKEDLKNGIEGTPVPAETETEAVPETETETETGADAS